MKVGDVFYSRSGITNMLYTLIGHEFCFYTGWIPGCHSGWATTTTRLEDMQLRIVVRKLKTDNHANNVAGLTGQSDTDQS